MPNLPPLPEPLRRLGAPAGTWLLGTVPVYYIASIVVFMMLTPDWDNPAGPHPVLAWSAAAGVILYTVWFGWWVRSQTMFVVSLVSVPLQVWYWASGIVQ